MGQNPQLYHIVNVHILMYVKNWQGGHLTHSAAKRGYQSLHAVKLRSAAQVDTGYVTVGGGGGW